jgi:hypothetical protein
MPLTFIDEESAVSCASLHFLANSLLACKSRNFSLMKHGSQSFSVAT